MPEESSFPVNFEQDRKEEKNLEENLEEKLEEKPEGKASSSPATNESAPEKIFYGKDFHDKNYNDKNVPDKGAPDLKMENFEGPLDLLCYLIEKNKINIYDIPIATITDQYLEYIATIPIIDLDFMSEFLVMASTLLHMKSRLLLPSKQNETVSAEEDPREELVMKLLEYRRCKALASELRERHDTYGKCVYRLPETARSLGLPAMRIQEEFGIEEFYRACKTVAERNEIRFFDVSNKIMHLLRREKISLKEKMKAIWNQVVNKTRVFFNELFPSTETSKAERVVGFLALLELLKLDRITAKQEGPFDVILIECDPATVKGDEQIFDRHYTKEKFEEIAYL